MKLIILDAGDSFELDGFNKLLLKNPKTNKTIIQEYVEKYDVSNTEVVVGYNAIAIMNEYPKYKYIYNSKWQITNNSYSLSLALNNEPCIVTSSDFFLKDTLVNKMSEYENCIVIKCNENKRLKSLNVKVSNKEIISIYYGKSSGNDSEMMGIFKITNLNLLKEWKKNCILHPDKYVGENLPLSSNIKIIEAEKNEIFEINSTQDYINLINNWEI